MKIFYFTSTGNNLHIAKKNNAELLSIPQLLKENRLEFEDDKMGIVFPCYYFNTPRLVKQFIERATFKSDYVFAVMSYGNMSAGAVNHFYRLAKKNNISLSYLNEIIMVDNYIPVFDMKNQIENAPKKKIEENIDKIVSDIENSRTYIKSKSFFERFLSIIGMALYNSKIKKADSRLSVDDTCNGCKICQKVCPVNNIKVELKPDFLHQCEECLGCAHHCPQNAIRVKSERSKDRFINEHIKVSEIIESNN